MAALRVQKPVHGGGHLKRAAAARRALRQAWQETPEEVSAVVEKLLLEDLTSQTQAHGMPAASFNARAWVEHRSRISASYKTSAYAAWSAAGILDNMVQGRIAQARAQAALLLLQLDQVASRLLEPGGGTGSGAGSTLSFAGHSQSAKCGRWREPFFPASRSEVVGSDVEPPEGRRRLCAEETGSGQEARSRRRPERGPRPKAKPKSKGKGQEPQDA